MITKKQLKDAIEPNFSAPNKSALDTIIKLHEKNKKPLLNIMGDWILDFGTIEIEPTREEIEDSFLCFVDEVNTFKTEVRDGTIPLLIEFLCENKDGFYDNLATSGSYKGMKLTKAIGKVLNDKPLLAGELQLIYSKIKPRVVCGNLKMSIHGMDFLTMSENNYNWRSCMSLDGCHASGTLSYMCDSSTVIMYLDGSKGKMERLPSCKVPWNNKKWRMLAYIDLDRECIYLGGKQYPTPNPILEKKSMEFLRQVFCKDAKVIYNLGEDESISQYLINVGSHYNDFNLANRRSFGLKGLITDNKISDKPIVVGSEVPCLSCANRNIALSEDWICDVCGDVYICEICGDTIDRNDVGDNFNIDEPICCWCLLECVSIDE